MAEDLFPERKSLLKIWRITALWAFSESAFGGILHALSIPFRGIFISGAAVIFISLLAFYSVRKNDIIKATITVLVIKALISPHTPVTAYLAVLLQGVTGQILFYHKKFFKTSALLLGIIAGLFSAFQKLIVLTIIYGTTIWESVDIFLDFIISQFGAEKSGAIRYSYILAGFYIFIHAAGGIFFGLIAGRIPQKIQDTKVHFTYEMISDDSRLFNKDKKRSRKWWNRPSYIIILTLSAILVVLSYFTDLQNNFAADIIIMIIRSIFIMFMWYSFLSPLVLKFINKIFAEKRKLYSEEVTKIIGLFPEFRKIISAVWSESSAYKGLNRIKIFLVNSFIILINYEENISSDR